MQMRWKGRAKHLMRGSHNPLGDRLRAVALLLALPALGCFPARSSAQSDVHLLPAPREAHWGEPALLPAKIVVTVPVRNAEDEFAAKDLEQAIAALEPGGKAGLPYRIALLRTGSAEASTVLARSKLDFDAAMRSEGYALVIEPRQAFVIGATGSGVFYGVQTLKQLLPLAGAVRALPTGTVRDWPAMRYRGIDDDLSRGPFPTLEFQKHQIRVFASFKANIYSPYFEHTLLYPDQPLAAPPGSSLTPAEAAELVAYARQYHVTIVPEQESFGHLHHVLKYDLYADLAETPHGHVLAPGQPGSIPLIQSWFKQIAQEFPSPFLHIGADETFDLGIGRTRDRVQAQGYGPVYVDFLTRIHDALAPLDKRLLFWGDIGDQNPAAVAALPKDMIAVPWYYGQATSFDSYIEPFTKNGIETWVAPGASNWNQVFPDAKTALWNIQGFVRDGQRLGATGTLMTVWNDDGEGLFNVDWYPVLFGAVAAWQPGESSIADYQASYGQAFHRDLSGKVNEAEKELMAAHDALAAAKTGLDSDTLFWLDPWSAEGRQVSASLLPQAVELRIHAERALVLLAQARQQNPALLEPGALAAMDLGARRLDLIGLKFELAEEIVSTYARILSTQHDAAQRTANDNLLSEISGTNGRCQDLRDAYSAAKDEYAQVWLGENRSYWLGNVAVRYDLAMQMWQQRAAAIASAVRGWRRGGDLPAPASLGIPTEPAL
jgi:hexosaminidase